MLKKSQSSVEFLILIGVVIFFFIVFTFAINLNMSDKIREKQNNLLIDTAKILQDEINLASKSTDGYYRVFKLPLDLNGREYNISIAEKLVYAKSLDNRDAIALIIPDVIGQPIKGNNNIKKEDGIIVLNP